MLGKIAFASLALTVAAGDWNRLFQDTAYENGQYGHFPIEEYFTTPLVSPLFNYLEYDGKCDKDGFHIMMTPRGFAVNHPGPMVLDAQGSLVWTDDKYQMPYNLKVQKYKGEQYLTFWAGDDGVVGHGSGMYYMLDSAYNEAYTVRAANGLDGDLHEFTITEAGTALITVYHVEPHDLSSIGGPTDGWIWDAIIQEVDIETGNAVFEWRASQHIDITDTFRERSDDEGFENNAFDWFHINSIEKDSSGNYLISSRHLHSVTHIDGKTGEVKWILGGKHNMFKDLSDGGATSFSWQHDVRWHDNHTAITMFDNESMGPSAPEAPSKGLYIDLDVDKMTAKVRTVFPAPSDSIALSQGSMQMLPNGNAFLGFGYNAMYTEYSPKGDIVCNVHFGPAVEYGGGQIQSYRIYKFPWVGLPTTAPMLDSLNETLFMSWMGATEIQKWRVEGASTWDAPDKKWKSAKIVDKAGFETETDLTSVRHQYVRVAALDSKGHVLGVSRSIDIGEEHAEPEPDNSWTSLGTMMINVAVFTAFAFVYVGIKRWWRYRHYDLAPDEMVEIEIDKVV